MISFNTILSIVDFITGTIGAKLNKTINFNSKKGLEGIFKKICGITLLIIFVPVSVLIPNKDVGNFALYVMFIGYMIMEITSLLENYQKFGINTTIFSKFLEIFKNNVNINDNDSNKTNKKGDLK